MLAYAFWGIDLALNLCLIVGFCHKKCWRLWPLVLAGIVGWAHLIQRLFWYEQARWTWRGCEDIYVLCDALLLLLWKPSCSWMNWAIALTSVDFLLSCRALADAPVFYIPDWTTPLQSLINTLSLAAFLVAMYSNESSTNQTEVEHA